MPYKKIPAAFVFPKLIKKDVDFFEKSGFDKYIDKRKLIGSLNQQNALSKANYVLKAADFLINTKVGNIILSRVSNGINSLANNANPLLPAYTQSSVLKSTVAEDTTRVYTVNFNVGFRTTKSIADAEKQHGSVKIQLKNSSVDCLDTNSRSFLRRSFGFNGVSFDFLNEYFYPTVKDYDDIYKISDWNLPPFSLQVPYGLVKYECSNIKIRNTGTFHKIIMKIHVVKLLDDDRSMHTLYNSVFNTNPDIQEDGRIPKIYQVTPKNNPDTVPNMFMNSCVCFKGTSVSLSPNFKTQAKVVHTVTRYLNPGDTLDFRMYHHCGPGIRFDVAKVYLNTAVKGTQPSGYGLIVEATGTACECVRNKDQAIFQGTSPGWYAFEASKSITVIRNSTVVSSSSDLQDSLTKAYAVKIHEREYMNTKPIYIPTTIIGAPNEQGKDFSVVSLSPERLAFASNSSDIPGSKEIFVNEEGEYDEYDDYTEEPDLS